jgi:hypothetical protein
MIWVEHVVYMGEVENACRIVRKREGKRRLGRYRCGWENNIEIDPRDWIG